MFDYELEHILSYAVTLNPPEVIGPFPEGIWANYLRHQRGGQRPEGLR